ncbi:MULTISPECIES: glutathione S-transferase family protein [Hydrocarboniphaga]|uniref:Glutathione S-transferase domain-containing protein n=1 Tax=Hydrocarboniphaga effusa AP103 TaxID=1172194 RepID=I7ZCB7_9GAMM|nr:MULTISPECIES: glutathione S-transferase family protein [Hydrocarboniphaga]EIT69489.1 glutathione S-transferase domain-containing protein [Hydrocarboniphaga effusa AP103]MDZ4080838.1 glutathione S-transferase family protein [Hydrocarboniphaga sp.]MDZ4080851.1 glutathione S-transferase family protein [Hydrocarboniphaga sp.]
MASPQLKLYAHPFSSYCQKALIALYENHTPFVFKELAIGDQAASDELGRLWPIKRFPVLVDGDKVVPEATIIIERLDALYPAPVRFIPDDAEAALDVRFLDRFFDHYIHTPSQKIVFDAIREPNRRDAQGVEEARAMLEQSYAWLDAHMAGREWVSGERFTLADCSAAPSLFYVDWVHKIDARFANVLAYRQRLNARPSFARAIDEARPYRQYFPLGAPERD